MKVSARDRRRIQLLALEDTLRRWRLQRWWDSLDWWTQIMAGACVVCIAELLVLYGLYPYLLEAVTA